MTDRPGGATSGEESRPDRERLRQAVHDSPAAEVATAGGDRPETFPLSPFYDDEKDAVVVTSPPAFSGKVDAVRENPQMSILFYAAEEPFLLRGRGTVHDDDLEANAEYVRELIESEPPSPKKEGFTKTGSVLDSRVGRFLFGWYALRVVVEVDPDAVEPVADASGQLPPWPVQDIDAGEAASYDRLVLTTVDDSGWPRSRPVADAAVEGGTVRLDVGGSVTDGQPGCLLAHWHTPDLEKLGQRLFRGRCRQHDGRVAFEPASSFSMRNETWLDRLKFVVEGKRRTRAYFRGA